MNAMGGMEPTPAKLTYALRDGRLVVRATAAVAGAQPVEVMSLDAACARELAAVIDAAFPPDARCPCRRGHVWDDRGGRWGFKE